MSHIEQEVVGALAISLTETNLLMGAMEAVSFSSIPTFCLQEQVQMLR
jgi:hypothetical protein